MVPVASCVAPVSNAEQVELWSEDGGEERLLVEKHGQSAFDAFAAVLGDPLLPALQAVEPDNIASDDAVSRIAAILHARRLLPLAAVAQQAGISPRWAKVSALNWGGHRCPNRVPVLTLEMRGPQPPVSEHSSGPIPRGLWPLHSSLNLTPPASEKVEFGARNLGPQSGGEN